VPGHTYASSYTVSWSGVSTASSYTLQEQVNGGGWTTVQANGSTSWTSSGHGNGTYGYQAQACNSSGCGPWSGVASTVDIVPAPIAMNGGSYTVSYTIPSTSSASDLIGFMIVNGSSWEVFSTYPLHPVNVLASGPVPAGASTVQYTYTSLGPLDCGRFHRHRV
jgi:hypothetical protein